VKQFLDDGYVITHKGLLCWSSIPVPGKRLPVRALFLLLESVFQILFWAMYSRDKTYYMPRLTSWTLSKFTHLGACSHVAIGEGMHGDSADLSPEQISELEVQTAAKQAQSKRTSASRTYAKAKAGARFSCGPCKYHGHSITDLEKHCRTAGHQHRINGTSKVVKDSKQQAYRLRHHAAIVASKKYHCTICNQTCRTQQHLNTHLASKKHLRKASEAQPEA
jgi:hypothetical protein